VKPLDTSCDTIMEIFLLPDWMLARLAISPAQRLHLTALASTLLALIAAPMLVRAPHFCLFQTFLHVPCPGCGITHALLAIARLDFAAAWRANPAGFVVGAFFALQLIARPVALFAERFEVVVSRVSRHASTVTVAALCGVWIWRLIVAL
jgi:hypothetical protein